MRAALRPRRRHDPRLVEQARRGARHRGRGRLRGRQLRRGNIARRLSAGTDTRGDGLEPGDAALPRGPGTRTPRLPVRRNPMGNEETAFDPVRYKQTTHEQWEAAAAAWHRWRWTLNRWLGPATDLVLDRAHVGAGKRVLDVAAGAGEQTLVIAR